MPAVKGTRPPNAGKGRPKGVPNKLTTAAKEAIELAAEGLGGALRLEAWVREDPQNERVFWSQIYTKLLPLQVTGENGRDLIPTAVQFIITKQPGSDNQT
jgi:hypothetical protein